MKSIPMELEHAARIDGCNDWDIYRRIVMPVTTPAIALVTIYNAVPLWNDFFFPLVFLQSDRLKTLPVGLTTFFGQHSTDWSLLFTGLSIAIMPMLVLYLFMSKYFIRGHDRRGDQIAEGTTIMNNPDERDTTRAEVARLKERYRRNLEESVIPFWLRHSVDREHGGYFCCLEPRRYGLRHRQVHVAAGSGRLDAFGAL